MHLCNAIAENQKYVHRKKDNRKILNKEITIYNQKYKHTQIYWQTIISIKTKIWDKNKFTKDLMREGGGGGGQFSRGQFFWEAIFRGQFSRGAHFPEGQFSAEKFSRRQLSGSIFPGDIFPGGNFPRTLNIIKVNFINYRVVTLKTSNKIKCTLTSGKIRQVIA